MSEAPDETTQEQDGPEPDETATPLQPPDEGDEGEAEESEAVEGAEGEGDESEPEAEPQASAQGPRELSQREIEGRLVKLNREGERHAKRVQEILEDHMADLTPCELCWSFAPGFRFDPIPEEQRAAVMLAVGLAPKRQLLPDPHSHACPECGGEGLVDTGSKVQGQDALPCKGCQGAGWVGDRAPTPVAAPPLSPVSEPDNGGPVGAAYSPEVEDAAAAARAAGLIVIDPRVQATS